MRVSDNVLIGVGGVAVIVAGIFIFLKTTSGKAVGENVAGVVTGFAGGVGSSVATVANDETLNPLHGVGVGIASIFGPDLAEWKP